ncbi:MAG: hypothetical protein M3N08_03185 [Pseudomonadota bacterium]|nr:hypothetical protein [Pseudomonadota bacterium]
MSAISSATSSQQTFFQAAQKSDQVKADSAATATNANPKPEAPIAAATVKPYESSKTRNADGTFGPKHTVLPPSSTNSSGSGSGAAVSGVNVHI